MAEKLPDIIDNLGDNTVVNAPRRLPPNLQKVDDRGGHVLEIEPFRRFQRPGSTPC